VFGNDVPQELPPRDSEGAFFCVQLNVELPEVVEVLFQVRDEAAILSGFYHDIFDINLKVASYFLIEAKLHTPLVCSTRVIQSE
jgi:hypothetical protein